MRFLLVLTLLAALALPAMAEGAPLVSYQREGGFAGIPLSLTVSKSGTARSATGTGATGERRKLSDRRFDKLKRLLRKARFADLDRDYRPRPGTVADGYTETVTYRGRTVVTGDGGTAPRRLTNLLGELSSIANQ